MTANDWSQPNKSDELIWKCLCLPQSLGTKRAFLSWSLRYRTGSQEETHKCSSASLYQMKAIKGKRIAYCYIKKMRSKPKTQILFFITSKKLQFRIHTGKQAAPHTEFMSTTQGNAIRTLESSATLGSDRHLEIRKMHLL